MSARETEWVSLMSELRAVKPRPILKLWRNGGTPEQQAWHKAEMKKWNKLYNHASKMQKKQLELDNALFRAQHNPISLPSVEFAIWGYAHGKTMFWNGRTFSPFKKTVERFASKIAAERKLYWLDENRRDKVPAGITTMGVMPL